MIAEVEGGQVVSLKGDPNHPVTRGFLCFRTSRFPEKQLGPDRIRSPLRRRGADLVPCGWDEALELAAEQLLRIRSESGPEAILHYRSAGSMGMLMGLSDLLFEGFGPCATKVGDVCSGAGEAAQELDFGISESSALETLEHARHILLWGKNPKVSSVHLVPILQRARKSGCRVTLIDPVHHAGVGLADQVLAPRPGGDLELALGVGRLLVDRDALHPLAEERCAGLDGWRRLVCSRPAAEWAAQAGVELGALEGLSDQLAEGPTAILVGWGMQRRKRGGAIVRALDALSAVTGNLYLRGGGCSFYFGRRTGFHELHQGPGIAPRTVREPMLGTDILACQDPPIRALWVTAGNPVDMLPDSARMSEAMDKVEFKVVVDPFLTGTASRADLVLPCPTLLEDADLLGAYGHHWMAESHALVPPPEGILTEPAMWQQMADRLGVEGFPSGSIDALKELHLPGPPHSEVTLAELRESGRIRRPSAPDVLFGDGKVATPDGRARLLQEIEPPDQPAQGALWLFSNSTEKSQSSQWAGAGLGAHAWIRVHPDAAPPGVAEGELVEVRGPVGSLQAELRLDPNQRLDVAIIPKGGHFDRGHGANGLIPAQLTDLGLGAAYLDVQVTLHPPAGGL